jgi:hypothetical protein
MLTDAQREILGHLLCPHTVLWDNLGLYGFPALERPNGDLQRVRRRDFDALVRRGLVVAGPPQPIDCPCRITEAGRAALGAWITATPESCTPDERKDR